MCVFVTKNDHFLLGVSCNHLVSSRLVFHGSRLVFMVFHGSRLVFHGSRLVFHGSWFHIYAQICPIGAPRSLVVPGLGGLKKTKVSQVPPPFNVKSDTIPIYILILLPYRPCVHAAINCVHGPLAPQGGLKSQKFQWQTPL